MFRFKNNKITFSLSFFIFQIKIQLQNIINDTFIILLLFVEVLLMNTERERDKRGEKILLIFK